VEGRLQIKSPSIKQRYVGINEPLIDEDGWIDTGDNVEKIGNRIFFLGRANGVLNVGGNKVHPEEVERLLLALPEVHAVKVYGKTSSIMGTLVVADIVPADQSQDLSALPKRIKEHLQKQAERFKIPAIINFVDQIDLTYNGKITRGVSE
jgi:acyl-CoA synthetase (AMP-forming)/AMP-acid ligase II